MTDKNNFQFKSDLISVKKSERTFSGVAYAGGVINHGYWGNVIFDLSTTKSDKKIPVLIDHDSDKRAGVTDDVTINRDSINMSGYFLSNKHATQLIDDADEGFPFQQSVHIQPGVIREIPETHPEIVNGIEVKGVTVFENSVIREISLTPTGVDMNTPTKIFSLKTEGRQMDNKQKTDPAIAELTKKVEELTTKLGEQIKRAEDAEAKLDAAKTETRKGAIDKIGKKFSDEEVKHLFAMDDKTFSFFASQMKPDKQELPDNLFSADFKQGHRNTEQGNPMLAAAQKIAGVK